MSTLSNGPEKPIAVEQVEDWIYAASRKRLELHLLATEPLYNSLRARAFIEMSTLLNDAIEEVRVISASLREESKELRAHAAKLREYSERLQESPKPQ